MEIQESEKRRARNLIWNAAQDYSFEPEVKAYDLEGQADLYWNSIIGAVRKNYDQEKIDKLFAAIAGCKDEEIYEQLLWMGLENAVFQKEAPKRPALPSLRETYAHYVLDNMTGVPTQLESLEAGHYRRVLGKPTGLGSWDEKVLNDLEFSGDLDTDQVVEAALHFLLVWYGFRPGKTQAKEAAERKQKKHWFIFNRKNDAVELPMVRALLRGYSEHTPAGGRMVGGALKMHHINDKSAEETEQAIKKHVTEFFGEALYDPRTTAKLEQELCRGNHQGCHLYYTTGSAHYDPNIRGYTANRRKDAIKQMDANRVAYKADAIRNRNSIIRLTARIRNALQAYLQPVTVRTSSGTLDAGRIWRGVYLNDDKVFTKVIQNDPGQLSVDILLDASNSQEKRTEIVSAQGYMIAESLTRCGIPVRVSSFCSLSGYTILTRYRDYFESDKNDNIFNYFTAGCNRDGLGIKALLHEMEDSPADRKIVILLSDAKPNDVVRMEQNGRKVDYGGDYGVLNTAAEVRTLTRQDISVICVFTGEDEDVPAAHTIYGRNFARIRNLDMFAETVGTLIQNQIRSF